jgi:hypothetical protein
MINVWDINAKALIAFSLTLIAIFLGIIVFKLTSRS